MISYTTILTGSEAVITVAVHRRWEPHHRDSEERRGSCLNAVCTTPSDVAAALRRLSRSSSVTDEPLPRVPDPAWNTFWRIDPRPDGSRAPDGPLVETVEDKFELITGGQAVAIVPADARISSLRPDLTTVPLEGVEPSHVVLATRAGDHNRLVAAFRKLAQAHLTGPNPAGPASVPPTPAKE